VQQLWLDVQKRIDNWYGAKRLAKYQQRVAQMGGLQIPGEETIDSAPAQKARILRMGVQARNRIGRLDQNGSFIDDYIAAHYKSIELAEEFFRQNSAWTPGLIFKVLDQCAALVGEAVADDDLDDRWHARRGCNVIFLIRNLDTIVRQLGLSASFPPIVFEDPSAPGHQAPAGQQVGA
jgi:hypothetical protein